MPGRCPIRFSLSGSAETTAELGELALAANVMLQHEEASGLTTAHALLRCLAAALWLRGLGCLTCHKLSARVIRVLSPCVTPRPRVRALERHGLVALSRPLGASRAICSSFPLSGLASRFNCRWRGSLGAHGSLPALSELLALSTPQLAVSHRHSMQQVEGTRRSKVALTPKRLSLSPLSFAVWGAVELTLKPSECLR